jgi:hypothetical protein
MPTLLRFADKPPRALAPLRPLGRPRSLLHHIYTILFAGGLGERGERRRPLVGGAGGAAKRRGGDGRVDSGRFSGRNGAYSRVSGNVSVGCNFSAFCGALALLHVRI